MGVNIPGQNGPIPTGAGNYARYNPPAHAAPAPPAHAGFIGSIGHAIAAASQGVGHVTGAVAPPPIAHGSLPGGDASPQLQALAHARIVQNYIHQVGHNGSLFPGLDNLPPQRQVPIVQMVLKETGLGALGFQEGVEALSQQVNPGDKAQLAEMNKAIAFQAHPGQGLGHPPGGGILLPPTGPDRIGPNPGGKGFNGAPAQLQKPIPLAKPVQSGKPAPFSPIPTGRFYQKPSVV